MAKPVKMYVTTICPYCVRAKRLLDDKGVAYETINVEGSDELRAEMVKLSGRRTVPQIWVGDVHVGGCDDLYALDGLGELDKLLAS